MPRLLSNVGSDMSSPDNNPLEKVDRLPDPNFYPKYFIFALLTTFGALYLLILVLAAVLSMFSMFFHGKYPDNLFVLADKLFVLAISPAVFVFFCIIFGSPCILLGSLSYAVMVRHGSTNTTVLLVSLVVANIPSWIYFTQGQWLAAMIWLIPTIVLGYVTHRFYGYFTNKNLNSFAPSDEGHQA